MSAIIWKKGTKKISQKSIIKIIKRNIVDLIVDNNETITLESDKIHEFNSITIKPYGTLTTTGYNGTSGGILALKIKTFLYIESHGCISVSHLGYRGGPAFPKLWVAKAFQGESYDGVYPNMDIINNFGAGGGGQG